jgi:Fur family ferric uptake transcriptional regulator
VGLSTVYRTLKLLERLGVAHRKSFGEGYSRYELRVGKPRRHALCFSCGVVIEFHEALLDYLALRLEREIGFLADFHELTSHGYCAACAPHEPTLARLAAPTRSPTKVAEKPS